MSILKKDILKALESITAPGEGKSLVESNSVKNIVVFDKEVIVDVEIGNPTLQAKKRVEVEIMKIIHEKVHPKASITVNVKAAVKEKKVADKAAVKKKKAAKKKIVNKTTKKKAARGKKK